MRGPPSILLVCSHGDDCCPYLTALRAVDFSVRIAEMDNAKLLLLSDGLVDAIAIHQDDLEGGCNIAGELKNAAPGIPLILLCGRCRSGLVQPFAVDAIYYADPADARLCKAAASLLRFNLELRT
jgi:hypothetical protein